MMRKFDNHVQKIKNEILREVSYHALNDSLEENISRIPFIVNPGPEPRFRCCVHHERAVSMERITMALGGNPDDKNVVEVLESACDQCPVNRYVVTETCRGCIAHSCKQSCPVDAIYFTNNKATIDYHKCIECGKCKKSCPYNSIADVMRPCRKECPTGAIQINEQKKAVIDADKCIACGQCVYGCPFGAIQEKSEIVQVIKEINRNSQHVYAALAPAFATQFDYAELGQVVTAIKLIGFRDVVEVALGADFILEKESEELLERKQQGEIMSSSCCPSYVNYVKMQYPELKGMISNTISPMAATTKLIKNVDPEARVVFIGPCIAKKMEKDQNEGADFVLTFEELAALIDAKEIDLDRLESAQLNNASAFGRQFASSGGVSDSIKKHIEILYGQTIEVAVGDGIEECDRLLKLKKYNRLKVDFIEGMACKGGCIKGPVTMHHGTKDLKALEKYTNSAFEQSSVDATLTFVDYNMDFENK